MSAMLLDDITFNSIANTLEAMQYTSDCHVAHLVDKIMSAISARRSAPAEIDSFSVGAWIISRFCEDLHRANVAGVNYRYSHRGSDLQSDYRCRPHHGRKLEPVALVKQLDCVNYQSSDVNDWEESPIGKELTEIRNALYQHIVQESAEWKSAAWSMNN